MQQYGKWLFDQLKSVVEHNPEKFFMNESTYNDRKVVVFDYALTIPNDFGYGEALETRGSCFEVDDELNYVSLVCLPFEKFFNPHELDYHGNDDLSVKLQERYGVTCNSEYVMELANSNDTIVMEKRDGSIISFFEWYGKLDCKSNSSLTSDYKNEALKLIQSQPQFYQLVKDLTALGNTVITEYTSRLPIRQIVLPYNCDELVVTGVRSHYDGSYMSYDDMVAYFGQDRVVEQFNKSVDTSIFNEENIEGYVIWHEPTNFRAKLKTQWYLDRHRIKESVLVPSNVWGMYINEKIDDVMQHVPESNREYLEYFVDRCEDLYTTIIHKGFELYDNYKHLERKDFFTELTCKDSDQIYSLAFIIAKNLYNGKSKQEAIEHIKEQMLISKKVSRLGITNWSYYD